MESYRKLEEVRRYSNKGLKVSRELIETVRGLCNTREIEVVPICVWHTGDGV